MKILAIETSCDETAAAVVEDKKIISNIVASQIKLHKQFGGVFPEHASRAHTEKIIPVVKQAIEDTGMSLSETPVTRTKFESRLARVAESEKISRGRNIDLIAVTIGPGLIGSLLVGVNFAKSYAYSKNIPIIPINHWLGHIYSNFVGDDLPKFPCLVLIVSGGHTGLVLMKSHNTIIPLGETLDDAVGEAFDKVAKLLGLGYPGGPAVSKTAQVGNPKAYSFPRSMLDRKDYNFSFSGLKTAVLNETKKQKNMNDQKIADFAASFQQAAIDILIGKTIQAAYEFRPKSICLCGGVSANKELREQLKKAVENLPQKTSYHVPPMTLTTDNAAMIGTAAAYHLELKTTWDNVNANSNLKL